MEIAVFGGGYVGLVTAAGFAAFGHRVRVFDTDAEKLTAIENGSAPFFEVGLDEAIREAHRAGRLVASRTVEGATAGADVAMICTGTPLTSDGESDVSQVAAAATMIAVGGTNVAVIVRSTLPLGASLELGMWLDRASMEGVATNPEFLRQGSALEDFRNPIRIVIGTSDGHPNRAARLLLDLYEQTPGARFVTDFATAEMIKNAANAFLATRLSLVNEIADLCEAYGANISDVTSAVGLDPRVGSSYMTPGIGFGGSCLPKELANLVRLAERKGLTVRALEGSGRSNDVRPVRIADRLERQLGLMRGRRVALLGLAFKAGTDDTRYSPAIALARALVAKGAEVVAHDPCVRTNAALPQGVKRVSHVEDAVEGAGLTVIATEWPDYLALDWSVLAGAAKVPALYDGRRLLDASRMADLGWRVISVGDGRGPAITWSPSGPEH